MKSKFFPIFQVHTNTWCIPTPTRLHTCDQERQPLLLIDWRQGYVYTHALRNKSFYLIFLCIFPFDYIFLSKSVSQQRFHSSYLRYSLTPGCTFRVSLRTCLWKARSSTKNATFLSSHQLTDDTGFRKLCTVNHRYLQHQQQGWKHSGGEREVLVRDKGALMPFKVTWQSCNATSDPACFLQTGQKQHRIKAAFNKRWLRISDRIMHLKKKRKKKINTKYHCKISTRKIN